MRGSVNLEVRLEVEGRKGRPVGIYNVDVDQVDL